MDTDIARLKMIEQQVRAWDVLDPEVLDVLGRVPREQFVPRRYESLAFADTEIPIGHGEFMMTPTVEGRTLQSLDLDGSERVLEIGTGTGFLTACLAKLGAQITSIDIHDDFLKRAEQNLADAGITNVELRKMDAMRELPAGPFDAIAVTGSVQNYDGRFEEALSDGGRLFVVVGDAPVMDAKLVRRHAGGEPEIDDLFETDLGPLVNAAWPVQFLF